MHINRKLEHRKAIIEREVNRKGEEKPAKVYVYMRVIIIGK
jgi:hypothetical protein